MLFNQLTLGKKIAAGFGIVLFLNVLLGLGAATGLHSLDTGVDSEIGARIHAMMNVVLAATAALVLLGAGISVFMTRRINSILAKIADGIEENALQVTAAAGQITAVSRKLAESSTEQAAAGQETSAALDEMATMSRQTSDLTAGSEKLMNENIEKSGQSLKALVELTRNMEQIEKDSDKIRSIINTIDSIAFQTNLLALNAAVEAARAGEAGAGFAVVADEVKNLANRSAAAARNTQELLDNTVSRVSESVEALNRINTDFDGIVTTATGIGDKTTAITRATEQQAAGIEQITKTSLDMDKVTQEVAQTAHQSADAAAQLAAQAEEMGVMVSHLLTTVYGKKRTAVPIAAPKSQVTCWEMKNCPTDRRDKCPAYPSRGNQCWMVTSTLCGGKEQGSYREKMANCRQCNVYVAAHGGGAEKQVAAGPASTVTCWEIKNCPPERRDKCPAYPADGGKCWMVTATLCGGKEQGSYREKMANCRKCNVYQLAHTGGGGQKRLPDLRSAA
ncbi:MAG: methyl-accepting chemotaxis protein [Thermodesulfobacteriota bacterium]